MDYLNKKEKEDNCMAWYKSEEEVDEIIENMIKRTKGSHITQSVSFNKRSPRQMRWLKLALMSSASFGGLVKEMFSERFADIDIEPVTVEQDSKPVQPEPKKDLPNTDNVIENVVKSKKIHIEREFKEVSENTRNVGNFL